MLGLREVQAGVPGGFGAALQVEFVGGRTVTDDVEAVGEFSCPGLQPLAAIEISATDDRDVKQLFEQPFVVTLGRAADDALNFNVLAGQRFEPCPAQRRRGGVQVQFGLVEGGVQQDGVKFVVVLDVELLLAALDLVERRLGDIDVATLDEQRQLTVEECQQQRADVRTVHVSVRHQDDAVVAQFLDVEFVATDATAECGDQRADLGG